MRAFLMKKIECIRKKIVNDNRKCFYHSPVTTFRVDSGLVDNTRFDDRLGSKATEITNLITNKLLNTFSRHELSFLQK